MGSIFTFIEFHLVHLVAVAVIVSARLEIDYTTTTDGPNFISGKHSVPPHAHKYKYIYTPIMHIIMYAICAREYNTYI